MSRHSHNLSFSDYGTSLEERGESYLGATIYLGIYSYFFINFYLFNRYLLSDNKVPGTGYVVESKSEMV